METYRVTVLTPGHMLHFRGKQVRTPVTFERVRKNEISIIDSQARRSLLKYEVIKESQIKKDAIIEEIDLLKEDESIQIEELTENKEPSTILEKLISEDMA
jgi:hypothetical protein